jgi:hypothetical protein
MDVWKRCMLPSITDHRPPVAHELHLSTLRFTAHDTDDWTGDNIFFYLLHLHLPHLQRFYSFLQHGWAAFLHNLGTTKKVIFTFTSPHVYNRHFTILHSQGVQCMVRFGSATGLAWGL